MAKTGYLRNKKTISYTALAALGVASACSADTGTSNGIPRGDAVQLNGGVQKGPYIVGSTIQVSNLDALGNPTGEIFSTTIINDLGQFELSFTPTELTSLEGSGYYYNEVTASLSVSPLTLRALYAASDKGAQDAYVNVITHLTYGRVRHLMLSGNAFDSAREQAEAELLQALDITPTGFNPNARGVSLNLLGGDSDENAYLLAVSTVLAHAAQLENPSSPDAALQQLLNQIAIDLEQTGGITSDRSARVTQAFATLDTTVMNAAFGQRLGSLGFSAALPALDRILDQDRDGLLNFEDNCPRAANLDQADLDGDGIGDVCDDDRDGDGVLNEHDSAPDDLNEWGDTDGINDAIDNCPTVNNPDQVDTDNDGHGDACDGCTEGARRCGYLENSIAQCTRKVPGRGSSDQWVDTFICGVYSNEFMCQEGACVNQCSGRGVKYDSRRDLDLVWDKPDGVRVFHVCDGQGTLRRFDCPQYSETCDSDDIPEDRTVLPIVEEEARELDMSHL